MYLKAHQEAHKQLSTKIKSLKGQLPNLDISHEIKALVGVVSNEPILFVGHKTNKS